MDIVAVVLWVTPPTIEPQPNARKRLPVRFLDRFRSLDPAMDLRFSDRSHMPKTSSPIPPTIWPIASSMQQPGANYDLLHSGF